MRVQTSARLQLEHAFAFVEGPDSGKGRPKMSDERLSAALQRAGERVGLGQRQANGCPQRQQLSRTEIDHRGKDEKSFFCLNGSQPDLDGNLRAVLVNA